MDVALDSAGVLYVADSGNHRIRVIASGQVSTLAGDGTAGLLDGPAPGARFNGPVGLAQSADGTLYVADSGNHCIRVISGGKVTTVAGDGTAGYLDGPAAGARFNAPAALALEGGDIYVADTGNHRIRVISGGQVSTLAGDGTAGYLDGPAGQARFRDPSGLALLGPKVLVIGDRNNCRLRLLRAP